MNYFFKILIFNFFIINTCKSQTVFYDDQSDLYGIMNEFGVITMTPKYKFMSQFYKGLAIFGTPNNIVDDNLQSDGLYGIIDESGKIVIPLDVYNHVQELSLVELENGIIQFNEIKNNEMTDNITKSFLKYYDTNGNLLLNMSSYSYYGVSNFKNGIAVIYDNDKYNFIDKSGNLLSKSWFRDYTEIDGVYYGIILNCREDLPWGHNYYFHNQVDNDLECVDLEFNEITLPTKLKKSFSQETIFKKYQTKLEICKSILKYCQCSVCWDLDETSEVLNLNYYFKLKEVNDLINNTYLNLRTNEKIKTTYNLGDSFLLEMKIDFVQFENKLFLVNENLEVLKDFSYFLENEDSYYYKNYINGLFIIETDKENYIINKKGDIIRKMKKPPVFDVNGIWEETQNH